VLGQLVGYLEAAGAETVDSELAIRWARLPVGVHPNQWAKRLRVARGFAAYLQTIDPTTEIPPPDVFPHRRQRATPYLFSLATLSTYLGHVSPADTYWYLSASPELMALAAERVHDRFGGTR
jgi:integrase/recombinase XerD